jgi:hypothetical protein
MPDLSGPFGLVEDVVRRALGKPNADMASPAAKAILSRLLMEVTQLLQLQSGGSNIISYKDYRNHSKQHFVQVPVNSTDASHKRYSKWIDQSIEINGGGDCHKSSKRMTNHLKRKYSEVFEEVLHEDGVILPDEMSAFQVAAMFKAGGVPTRKARRGILQVLHHHFGRHAFSPEHKIDMLSEGTTQVFTGSIKYAYDENAIKETLEFQQKNIARETEAQLGRQLQTRKIMLTDIDRVDICTGGDHGIGAFIFSA